jgi:hypothetical protein
MNPLVQYYLHQAGRGKTDGIGPVYVLPPFHQRGYGIGSYLSGLWRVFRPFLWKGAKRVGRETLRTGGKILTDIADSESNPQHIISSNVTEAINRLRGSGKRKRKTTTTIRAKRVRKSTKRDIFFP